MFRYSFNYQTQADALELAISNVLNNNLFTADIAKSKDKAISCTQMGNEVIKELAKVLK
jgi:isocitrate dehydrogenase